MSRNYNQKSNKKNTGRGASTGKKTSARSPRGSSFSGKQHRPQKAFGGSIEGTIQSSGKGYAFLIPDDTNVKGLFIPASSLHSAMHGDRVVVKQVKEGSAGRGGEGEVESVLSRRNQRVVGTFEFANSFAFVLPDDKRVSDIFIARENFAKAKNGQKVVAEIIKYPDRHNKAEGVVAEILGYPDETGTDVLSIIRKYGLYEEFDAGVLREAAKVQKAVLQEDLAGRVDFRDKLTITIDGEDARDLDDAVSLDKDGKNYVLGVHIADVSHYVSAGTRLDKEAFKRGTSVYFPGGVLPMLPRELSNGICSLNENVDRLTLSAVMTFSPAGELLERQIVCGVIKTANRMTYTDIQAILDGDKKTAGQYPHLTGLCKDMQKLMKILQAKRHSRGAVDLEIPECKIILDEKTGKISEIVANPRLESHRIIEEFMLAANEAVAEWMFNEKMPSVYRIHEVPSEEKVETLAAFVEGFGLKLEKKGEKLKPKELQKLIESSKGKPGEAVISRVALRSMQKAKYSTENLGHFGLAAKFYCHFTSPIRRYPDLSIHRIIKEYLKSGIDALGKFKGFALDSAENSSIREQVADEAEREIDDLKKAEYMRDRIGECFDAVVSGVTEFGVFAELSNTCEGLIRAENLPDDSYDFHANKFALIGQNHVFRLGDPIKIKVAGVDMSSYKAEFVFAE